MSTLLLSFAVAPALLRFAAAPAAAILAFAAPDEVIFKNGEKIVGKITNVIDGKITIESESMGVVKAPLDKVATFSTSEPIEIRFDDGTIVKQRVTAGETGFVMLSKDGILEPQKLPLSKVKKINPPPVKWTGDLSAGATFTRGNSDTDNASIDFNAQRRSEDDRITFKAFYASTRTKDAATNAWSTTQDRFGGKLQYDYFLNEWLYAFASAAAEKDRIAFLDLRFIAAAGLGQQWAESEDFSFSTEEGVSWTSENYSNATPDTDYMGALLAYHLKGKFFDGLTGFHNLNYNQSLERAEDSFVYGDVGLRASFSKAMFAEAKVEVRWDNTPAIGAERTDVRYILGVGWSF
jgi:putative salt-induced outer membrane protein YdiY